MIEKFEKLNGTSPTALQKYQLIQKSTEISVVKMETILLVPSKLTVSFMMFDFGAPGGYGILKEITPLSFFCCNMAKYP